MENKFGQTIWKVVEKLNDGCHFQMSNDIKEILDEFTSLGYSYRIQLEYNGDNIISCPLDIVHLDILNIVVNNFENNDCIEYYLYKDHKFDKTFWCFMEHA